MQWAPLENPHDPGYVPILLNDHERAKGLAGRVNSVRIAGKALIFLDVVQDGHQLQGVCALDKIGAFTGISSEDFRHFYHLVRRGDIICESYETLQAYLILTYS